MRIEKIATATDAMTLLERIGCDAGGRKILQKKMRLHLFYIKELHVGAANILKQDALSVGADLAVPKGAVVAKEPYVDALLITDTRALERLAKKELAQPFRLKELARTLREYLHVKRRRVQIMGVINANEDSFYPQSRFYADAAIERIEQMIAEGADIVDIGGVSSRPGSEAVSPEEELRRIEPIVELIASERLYERALFSIDSYAPEVIAYALEHGFRIVNDITGLRDERVCEVAAKRDAKVVIMHMQGTPQNMQKNPHYDDVVAEVGDFFEERIERAHRFGIEDIVLDVGIGFGKRLEDNLRLVASLESFERFGYPLLVGASRKSMIDMLSSAPVEERLGGTLAVHLEAVRNGAQILRVHDVKEHRQALTLQEVLHSPFSFR